MTDIQEKGKENKMWIVIAIAAAVLGVIVWGVTRKSQFGHWARITVSILTGCFIFPHAFTENDEVAGTGADKKVQIEKQ